ncbi:membrane protein insertion efficiency factor YidD [Polynucleobacter sp. 30F-ANTBAC]|nr:membrane protein insertion efficiency factor YidD [Polynucleobacter sp. 30F-ANTBAC]
MSKMLQGLVRLYQITSSPYWGAQCRFYPTCSCYAIDALKQYGAIKGTYLAVNRICRCNPWAKGGIDLVPEKVIKK